IHYWFPKITGRMYPEGWGLLSAALVFAGFFVTFFPQFLLGNGGMPRRYYNYPEEFQVLHVVSTARSWVLATGMIITLGYRFWAARWGKVAGPNPWESRCFEWRTPSPPPTHNFEESPVFAVGAYDYTRPLEEEKP